MMESYSGTLRDIHGLDGVPWWPPAPGWWYVIAAVALVPVVIAIGYGLVHHGPWLGWRSDARRKLNALRKALPRENPREVAGRLSELLRRIAMARSGRRVAAGLTGETWLHWLAEKDTSGFEWEERGQVLLKAPYMPPSMEVERKELALLIRAATRWIDATQPTRKGVGLRTRTRTVRVGILGKSGSGHV
jgi:hypothetical protein